MEVLCRESIHRARVNVSNGEKPLKGLVLRKESGRKAEREWNCVLHSQYVW